MVLLYETHSTSLDNEAGRASGWLPDELSETGRQQAAELGHRHAGDRLDAILVSDLRRAVQTAAIAFGHTGIPIIQDPRLRECNYGRLNGAPLDQHHAERAHHVDVPWPDGESYRQVVDRTRAFLADAAGRWPAGQVLVIAHSANKLAFDCLLLGAQLEDSVAEPFTWQPGWRYDVPDGWR